MVWFVQGYTAFLHVESRVRCNYLIHYNRWYTTVKLLSLKRQKIGMIHINCFQPKHMATYIVGARKPSQEAFLLNTQKIRGL